jgi:transcriptional regulator with XRE-family HTH domain
MNALTHIRTGLFRIETQKEFADLIGVEQSTVSRWEKGATPDFANIRRIQTLAAERSIQCPDALFDQVGSAA